MLLRGVACPPRWLSLFWDRYAWSVVDQREIQRLGGVCARHPYSCFFASVVDAYAGLDNRPRIVDLTYGVGGFYVAWRECIGYLVGIDVRRWEWLVEPDLFVMGRFEEKYRELPVNGFDVVVFDPPYATRATERIKRNGRAEYYYYGAKRLREMIDALPRVARYLLAENGVVVVKIMDAHRHGVVDAETSHTHVVQRMLDADYTLTDILVYRSITYWRPQRRGKHYTKTHSYILVFKP